MCVALIGLCASAQEKGEAAVGLNLGVAPCVESGTSVTNFGIGAKFQYNVSDPVRLEADLDYWFKSDGMDIFDISANIHYLFSAGSIVKIYPLVGIGYARVKATADFNYGGSDFSISASANRFLLNVGAGFQFAVSERVALGAEIKYQYIKDFSRIPISIGMTYLF